MGINRKTAIIIGMIGVLLGIAGLAVYLAKPDWVIAYTTLEALAAIHLIVFFITHFEVLREVSHQRSTQFGANSILMVVIFVAILGIINFMIAQHEVRVDFSGADTFTLSPQTVQILKGLKQDVKISGFFAESGGKGTSAKALFENYRHQSTKVKYEMIDPDKKPMIAKQYGITQYDTVIVESKGQSVTLNTLSEQELTSAMIRLGRSSKKQFYFIEGHGEHPIDNAEREGYSHVKASLEKQGFSIKRLILLSEKTVPDDAAVVVIGGPTNQYPEEEQTLIHDYLTRGGKLLALIDPLSKSNLEPLLAKWGVLLENDIVVDASSGLGPATPIIAPDGYLPHEITNKFNKVTFYSLVRSVGFDGAYGEKLRFDSFLQTGPDSWATKRISNEISIDPNQDQKGPIVIGGVFSHKKRGDEKEESAASKMQIVVIGDSDFATNGLAQSAGNGDLFQNIVSFLAQEHDLISIRPKASQIEALILSKAQQQMIFYFSVLILPIGILIFGLIISRKRRYL
ncbi:MAG: Gldg family protein [Nitrospirota bacterium]